MINRYTATVVDLVPGISDETRAAECSSVADGPTVTAAEQHAIENSAANCNRRVYVQDNLSMAIVKGPYILRRGQ